VTTNNEENKKEDKNNYLNKKELIDVKK